MQIADAVLYNLSPSNGSSPPPLTNHQGDRDLYAHTWLDARRNPGSGSQGSQETIAIHT